MRMGIGRTGLRPRVAVIVHGLGAVSAAVGHPRTTKTHAAAAGTTRVLGEGGEDEGSDLGIDWIKQPMLRSLVAAEFLLFLSRPALSVCIY